MGRISGIAIGVEIRPRFLSVQKPARTKRPFPFLRQKAWAGGGLWACLLLGWWMVAPVQAEPIDPAKTLPDKELAVLSEILVQALKQSPDMLMQSVALAQADVDRMQRASGLWPSIYGDLHYASNVVATTNSETQKSDGFFYNFEFHQPVYHWGAVKAWADIGGLQRKIAQKQFAEAYRLLVGLLRQQFLGLIRQKKLLQTQSFNLEMAERGYKLDEEAYAKGGLAPAAIANSRLAIEETRLTVARTQSDGQQLKRIFMRLAGLGELSDERIPATLSRPGWVDDQATRLVAEFQQTDGALKTPQAEVFKYLIRQDDLNYRIAKTRLLPQLNFFADVNLQNQTYATSTSVSQVATTNRTYGVIANWSIFDGFATRSAKLGALAGKRQHALQQQMYVASLQDDLRALTEQSNLAARAVALSEQRLAMAAGSLSYAQEEAKQGRASPISVAQAQVGFDGAELAALDNRIALYNQWSRLVGLLWVDPILQNLPATYLDHGK
jgi:outer membrane protein TolC